jgi:hypothetical protein
VDPMQIFWLFFMLATLQPVITQRLLEASRKRLIGRIERERQSRVVLLVHRQAVVSPNRNNPLERLQSTQELPLCSHRFC